MQKPNIMVCGLPGNVAQNVARHVAADPDFNLVPLALTGPGIQDTHVDVDGTRVELVLPHGHEKALAGAKEKCAPLMIVDYTHPSTVNANAELYAKVGVPFVMGTTGGEREALFKTVENSEIAAVIAPNMVKQIVGLSAMFEYAAENFPGLFDGFSMEVRESHQKGKADTSGTAKAMVGYFNRMGIDFPVDRIQKERDPERQRNEWGVPEHCITGHGWHTYTLTSPDGNVVFEFTHNVCGRDVYSHGTLDALRWLWNNMRAGARGRVFSMIDVLRGE
ncbi:MAG: dihydrodipicolinate reductase [Desulfatibacillaceae bacterium]